MLNSSFNNIVRAGLWLALTRGNSLLAVVSNELTSIPELGVFTNDTVKEDNILQVVETYHHAYVDSDNLKKAWKATINKLDKFTDNARALLEIPGRYNIGGLEPQYETKPVNDYNLDDFMRQVNFLRCKDRVPYTIYAVISNGIAHLMCLKHEPKPVHGVKVEVIHNLMVPSGGAPGVLASKPLDNIEAFSAIDNFLNKEASDYDIAFVCTPIRVNDMIYSELRWGIKK